MIIDIQNGIINRLESITEVKTFGVWQGNVQGLLQQTAQHPSIYVIYEGGRYGDKKTIGGIYADIDMTYNVISITQNERGTADRANDAYEILEAIREKLIGYEIAPYGYLWPISEQLQYAMNSTFLYSSLFKIKTEFKGGIS